MNDSLITVRYVKALYQLAEEEEKQNFVEKDIKVILSSIMESQIFKDFLSSPLLKKQ
ncbi:hypothetical protein ES705_32484 [subsurface metagenome]